MTTTTADSETPKIVSKDTPRLKHYHRKKFFYKLFLRKSPRNAALFGFSWIIFYLSLIPLLFMSSVLPRLLEWMQPNELKMGLLAFFAVFMGISLLILLPYVYGLCVLGYAYNRMIRCYLPQKWLRGVGSLCAFLYKAGGLLLIPIFIRQKRWIFAVLGAISLICAGIELAYQYGLLPFAINPYAVWGLVWVGIITLTIAIAGLSDKHKLKLHYLWPLALLILYVIGLRYYNAKLERDIIHGRAVISQMLGHSIELKDYWSRQNQGIPLDAEPLKSLIAHYNPDSDLFVLDPVLSITDYQQKLEVYKKKNPKFIDAVNALVKLPPQSIRHAYTDETLASVSMPELNVLRGAARYLCHELIVNSANRSEVLRCNAELETIRDWCLVDRTFVISRLVAIAVEKLRLEALSYPLAAGTLNSTDWERILQKKTPWGAAFADAMGDEATTFQSCYEYATINQFNSKTITQTGWPRTVQQYLSIEFSIIFKRDYLFALSEFQKLKLFLEPGNMTAKELYERAAPDQITMRKNFFIFSSMLLPSLNTLHIKQGEIEDFRRLSGIAVAVERYRKDNGKLPDSLAFLPEQPLDSMNRLPVIYEHGEIKIMGDKRKVLHCYGFRLYTRDRDGKDPGGLKAKNAFTVILKSPNPPDVKK